MKKILIALAIVMSTFVSAHAQSRFVTESQNESVYRESVANYSDNNGLVASGWWKFVGKNDNGTTTRFLIQVHCSTRLFRFVRSLDYKQGRVTYDSGENWSEPWENPIPGTVSESFQQMCTVR